MALISKDSFKKVDKETVYIAKLRQPIRYLPVVKISIFKSIPTEVRQEK